MFLFFWKVSDVLMFHSSVTDHNLVVSKELEELIEMYRMEASLQREDSDVSLGSENGLKVKTS